MHDSMDDTIGYTLERNFRIIPEHEHEPSQLSLRPQRFTDVRLTLIRGCLHHERTEPTHQGCPVALTPLNGN